MTRLTAAMHHIQTVYVLPGVTVSLFGKRVGDGVCYLMTGGRYGEHSISEPVISDESQRRMVAHWKGYIRNQLPQ